MTDRTPEQQAAWQGVQRIIDELGDGRHGGMRTAGEFRIEERPGETPETWYTVDCTRKIGQEDGTDQQYEITVQIVKSVDSHDEYWAKQLSDRSNAVVIDGVHYRLGKGTGPRDARGFGGRRWEIQYLPADDEDAPEPLVVNDLWYQGPIPPKHRPNFPDNARFIGSQGPFPRSL